MKILQVNCVYGHGSTGKIVCDIHTELLSRGHDSVVCYGRGGRCTDQGVYKTCTEFCSKVNHLWANISGVMYGGCFFPTGKLISVIKRESPDIVHLHCINGYFVNIYRLIKWLKKNSIRTVLTLHAEFMYTGGCGYSFECEKWRDPSGCGKCDGFKAVTGSYFIDGTHRMWRKMNRAFSDFDDRLTVTSVSPWLMDRAEQSVILGRKTHSVVYNGINTDIFRHYGANDAAEVRRELGITSSHIIFHATAAFSADPQNIKGGYYLLELAKTMPEVTFIVAGTVLGDIADLPENVILLGKVTDQSRLARMYSMADLTLLTSRRETFSMIVAESLSCGTPVVGFLAGAPETIAIPEYSEFVDFGSIAGLRRAALHRLSEDSDPVAVSSAAHSVYSRDKMVDDYLEVYDDLMKG